MTEDLIPLPVLRERGYHGGHGADAVEDLRCPPGRRRTDDKAREAAEEIAGFEDRPTTVEPDLKLLKGMVGFNLAMSMVIVALLLRLAT